MKLKLLSIFKRKSNQLSAEEQRLEQAFKDWNDNSKDPAVKLPAVAVNAPPLIPKITIVSPPTDYPNFSMMTSAPVFSYATNSVQFVSARTDVSSIEPVYEQGSRLPVAVKINNSTYRITDNKKEEEVET
jgi:hypothetical protein